MIRLPLAIALLVLGVFHTLTTSSSLAAAGYQIAEPERVPAPAAKSSEDKEDTPSESDDAGESASPAHFLFPDVPSRALVYDGKRFVIRPVFAVVADYTFVQQDERSVTQVGEQADSRDLRAGRVGLIIHSKRERGWSAAFVADYQEPRTREGQVFRVYDLRLRVPVGPINVEFGKQKQPFSFEVAGLSILNP